MTASLRERLRDILVEEDPECLHFDDLDNRDEYDSEIDAIMEGIPACASREVVAALVLRVFKEAFGDQMTVSEAKVRNISERIWQLIGNHPSGEAPR